MSDIARRRFLQATAIGGAASVGLLPSAQAQTAATPAALTVGGPSSPLPRSRRLTWCARCTWPI